MNLVDLSLAAGIAMAILFTRGTQCACGQELSAPRSLRKTQPQLQIQREDSEIKVIRDQIAHYVEAFNRHDGKSLAGFWTKSGEFTATSGHTWRGAAELQECFESYFRDQPDARLELAETDVRILSPSVAMETGLAHVVRPDQAPVSTQYEAIHVRTADGWRIDRLSEQALDEQAVPTHVAELSPISWMVGTWAENTEDAHVELSCRWTTNQNFLLLSYRVVRDEAVDFQVSQIIGWDPQKQVIRSWQFDSDGGYGVGRWKATSDGWSVQTRQVLQDGRNAAATYFYDRPADDRLRFRSLGREIEGELVEDIEPLELGRVSED